MKEWHRTVILILIAFIAIAFIVWSRQNYDTNFVDTL